MEIILVYALLTSAMFYLGSRATITQWLWSRYPPKLARLADCSACSGFWYGLLVGSAAWVAKYPGTSACPWFTIFGERGSPLVVALCSMVWTPIVSGYMQAAIERLGSAVPAEDDGLGPAIEDEDADG